LVDHEPKAADNAVEETLEDQTTEQQELRLPPEQILEALGEQAADTAMYPSSLRQVYLFAYDLMLSQEFVARFAKGLVPEKIVRLINTRLAWPYHYPPMNSSLPTLERSNSTNDEVWGILYNTGDVDLGQLEDYLRVPNRYYKKAVTVMDRGERRIPAFTYVLAIKNNLEISPAAAYMDALINAARERSLPAAWIENLEAIPVCS